MNFPSLQVSNFFDKPDHIRDYAESLNYQKPNGNYPGLRAKPEDQFGHELFENIRDASLIGDKTKLNNLLSNFAFSNEDAYLYLNMINYRLIKLLEIHKTNESFDDFNVTITKMRPPIFWKDKPVYLKLLKRWHKQSIIEALEYLGHTEEKLKKNSSLNSLTMVKNSILNICSNSWAYF